VTVLSTPEIVACNVVSLCLGDLFVSELGVLELDWSETCGIDSQRMWSLPLDQTVVGRPPQRFGIRVVRVEPDRYSVHLLWNRSGMAWTDLTRAEIKDTDLGEILEAVGTSIDSLLTQPVRA
jgi:hypothetical protein